MGELQTKVALLEDAVRHLQAELQSVVKDQHHQYMYARKHLSFFTRLCTQVERILLHEDARSRSLGLLHAINQDALKSMERYHAPSTCDPYHFLRQRTAPNLKSDEELNIWGNYPAVSNQTGEPDLIGLCKYTHKPTRFWWLTLTNRRSENSCSCLLCEANSEKQLT